MPSFSLTFKSPSPQRLLAARRLFCELQAAKNQEGVMEPTDPHWRTFLDPQAERHFECVFDFQSPEGQAYQQLWKLTAPAVRVDHSMFVPPGPWDFVSIIETLLAGEYELLDLTENELLYQPYASPFGGTEALIQFLEAFGQTVTHDSYHKGPPPRSVSTWDYDAALRLIERGKGVS